MKKTSIKGIGVDIEMIEEVKKSIKNRNFLKSVFSEKEIEYCSKKRNPEISYTGKFCAKEAVKKAIGTKFQINEIEILNSSSGNPEIYIKGKKQDKIKCSISHTHKTAIAFVIVES